MGYFHGVGLLFLKDLSIFNKIHVESMSKTIKESLMVKKKIKVYIYTRVSTTMQIDGYSLDVQRTRMRDFAELIIV